MLCFISEAPGSPIITSTPEDIQATSLTLRWTAPVDDGGSPITAYQVGILQERNVTKPTWRSLEIRELQKNTHYTVMLSARNYVFKGNASHKNMKTKIEGKYYCEQTWLYTLSRSYGVIFWTILRPVSLSLACSRSLDNGELCENNCDASN